MLRESQETAGCSIECRQTTTNQMNTLSGTEMRDSERAFICPSPKLYQRSDMIQSFPAHREQDLLSTTIGIPKGMNFISGDKKWLHGDFRICNQKRSG
jgi:hypothetical protein